MTEKLYFSSDETFADVSVETCVAVQEGYEIILDRTVFHPQGGRQPSDIGHIDVPRVKKVFQRGADLVHAVTPGLESLRLSLSCFVGYRGPAAPLRFWS